MNLQAVPYYALKAETDRREFLIQEGKCPNCAWSFQECKCNRERVNVQAAKCPNCSQMPEKCMCNWERGKVYGGRPIGSRTRTIIHHGGVRC